MRTVTTIVLLLIFSMGILAGEKTKTIMNVEGMKDKTCVEKITKAVNNIDGVENVSVDLKTAQVIIQHNNANITSINSAIVNAGYKTNHKKQEKLEEVEAEEGCCSGIKDDGCKSPCGRKR